MSKAISKWKKYPAYWHELSLDCNNVNQLLICRDLNTAYNAEYDSTRISESLDIEDKFINVIRQIMDKAGCHYFCLYEGYPYLAYRPDCPLFKYITKEEYQKTGCTKRISADKIDVYIRLQLRNIHWFLIANNKKHIQITFGNDYHMAIYTRLDTRILKKICHMAGLRFKTGTKTDNMN